MESRTVSQSANHLTTAPIAIVDYRPEHQPWFEKFNKEWIEKYFYLEPIDKKVLEEPNVYILAKGGHILMAKWYEEIAGAAALRYVDASTYEFTKMAVDPHHRGKHIGQALTEACIHLAWSLGATRVILYSNTRLVPAISLYRKLGFVEVPVDAVYARSDIKMELIKNSKR